MTSSFEEILCLRGTLLASQCRKIKRKSGYQGTRFALRLINHPFMWLFCKTRPKILLSDPETPLTTPRLLPLRRSTRSYGNYQSPQYVRIVRQGKLTLLEISRASVFFPEKNEKRFKGDYILSSFSNPKILVPLSKKYSLTLAGFYLEFIFWGRIPEWPELIRPRASKGGLEACSPENVLK